MASFTLQRGTTLPDSAGKNDFHNLIDTATGTVTGITTSDISASAGIVGTQLSASAAIAPTQLAQITTAGKVHGSSITGLASVPSGAGVIPIANLASGTATGSKFIRDDGTLQVPTVAATQAEMEAASSNTVSVTPGRAQYHPGVAKAWCVFSGTATGTNAPTAGHNVTSVTRNSAGSYTVNLTTAFSSSDYAVIVSGRAAGSELHISITSTTTSAITFTTGGSNVVSGEDQTTLHLVAFGDQ